MWNDKPDGYLIPAWNPTGMGTGMNFYPRVRVWVQISTRSLFAGGRVIALPDPNPTRCHPYSWTTSSIAPKETWPAASLGTTPEEEAQLAVILGTTKCWCLHVFTLDLWSCLWMLCCVCMWWILWSLNECVEYCDLWMNVLDLDMYMDILYIMCAMYMFYNSSWLYSFLKKIIAKTNIQRLGCAITTKRG
jgi:hypothetical protein